MTTLNNERESFIRYCKYIGIEPNVLAEAWLHKKGKNIEAMNRRILSFSEKLPIFNFNIENSSSHIDQVINLHRQFAYENKS